MGGKAGGWGLALAAALTMACAGQQAGAPAAASKDAKTPTGGDGGALNAHSLEQGRADLRAAEAAHPGNTPEVFDALIQLVYDETLAGSTLEETVATADRAIKVAESAEGKESSNYAIGLGTKAYALMILDRPELARPMAEEALGIEQRIGSDPLGLSDVAHALIFACQRTGDYVCAERTAELQVKTLRGMEKPDDMRMATALVNLMLIRMQLREMAKGKEAADESMAIAKRAETVTPDWAILENDAGGFYENDGDLQLALEHLSRSLDLDAQLKSPDSVAQGGAMANLASVEMCLGRTRDALAHYLRAWELYIKRYGPGHSETAHVAACYGYALSFVGRYEEAIGVALAAHRMQRERIRLAVQLMPEQEALAMANTGAESFNVAMSIATHHAKFGTAEVYQEVVRSRALVAEEMARREAVLNREHDPALETLKQELQQEGKAVMELQGTPAANHAASALSDATAKMEQTERELAERSAAFRADERSENSDLGDLRRNMPAGSVLVSYVSYQKYAEEIDKFNKPSVAEYMAFVLHRDSERIGVYDLGDAQQIALLVKRMRASADAEAHGGGMGSVRNEREYREAGLELRKRIWDPLAKELQGAKLALVTPDGVLNLAPFSALPSGMGYLVEHGPVIHILTSERDLIPAARGDKKAGLLAVGSPSFELAERDGRPTGKNTAELRSAGITCEAFTAMQFHALPGSLSEVKDISTAWKRWNAKEPERLLTGEDATRSRFLEEAPQSRVLHIATHAFVLEKSCGNGNPLMHSGLVFAGANKSRDASILTAQQIASLDLRGVDWAVLSACDTGNGELKDGEGVLGLERSFRVAGAKSVVMALWPVDDTVTREFMRGLYAERFGRRATTADAVWNADRRLLKERQAEGKSTHPWYWAGFVGAGAWD
ncbi:MAG: CHAT domain-containing tetratricopeptide repeat protein [Terracidiphilus sp.]|jgi:CHAT domain-containing protein